MLEAVGVPFEAVDAMVDEETAKAALKAEGIGARHLADALAELKAMRVSQRHPSAIVLGCDQTLAMDDGTVLDKPGIAVAEQLRMLSGRTHRLHSAIVACSDGKPIWRSVDTATLTMRPLSEAFIAEYAASEGGAVAGCVGGYRIEGLGAQLFTRIEGSHFTILGLPLLSLLDWLRARRIMMS